MDYIPHDKLRLHQPLIYIVSAQTDDALEEVSLTKANIQSLADAYKRQASKLPDPLKDLMPTLYGSNWLKAQFFWGLRSFRDIQGLHTLRCRPQRKGHKTSIIDAALNRLHHCFPAVSSSVQLKCFLVEAEPVCLHPYFRHATRSPGSIMTENPRALAPEYWDYYYPQVFAFHRGIELLQRQPNHRLLSELNYQQWENLLQTIYEAYGPIAWEALDAESLMPCIANVCA